MARATATGSVSRARGMQLGSWLPLSPFSPTLHRPLPSSFHSCGSHCTSRYMDWESWPIVLLAVQTYSPASVYWMLFRVRDDTRAWLCTTKCPSRVCQEGRECVRAHGGAGGGDRATSSLGPVSPSLPKLCPCLLLTVPASVGGSGERHGNSSASKIENGTQFMGSSLDSVPRLVRGKDKQGPPRRLCLVRLRWKQKPWPVDGPAATALRPETLGNLRPVLSFQASAHLAAPWCTHA